MPITPIPAMPEAPAPTDDRATFTAKSFAYFAALPDTTESMNVLGGEVEAFAEQADADATAAEAARAEAVAAASAASGFSTAAKWVSGTVYADGAVVWSPTNYLSYRRKGAGAGATDPSADSGPAGNWVLQDKGPVGALFSINVNTTAVRFATYELGTSAFVLSLPATAAAGDWIGVIPPAVTVSGQAIGNNGHKLLDAVENMYVDVVEPFRLVYISAARGWVMGA